MADIGKLKGITSAEAEALRNCEVRTVEDLWLRISDAGDNSLQPLLDKTEIEKNRLIDLLAAEGMREPGLTGAWFKHHWFDILIVLVVVTVALCIWRQW